MKLANRIIKSALLSTISVASLGYGSIAFAQDEQAAAEEKSYEDDAIIVTATKREQTLQDVPVAVSVTSAATIERAQIRDLNDLQNVAPTLRVSQLQTSANTNFIIRGFGNGANNAGIEPSVGVFIDGVYRSRSASAIGDLPNIQRVEVLRGPQSTLFGKNASAGVISIISREPQYAFGGSAEISYGNYNAIVAKADITGPISENMAFSLAGGINKRDGYATIVNTGEKSNERDRWFARAQLLIEPSDTVKFRIIGDYDRIDENCCIAGNVLDGPTGAIVRALGGNLNSNDGLGYNVFANFATFNKIDNYGASIQGDIDLGSLSVTSITAYRKSKTNTDQDSDFTSLDLLGRNKQMQNIRTFTQELRLASDFDGPLNFLLGAYYFDEKVQQNNNIGWGVGARAYANGLISGATGGALSVPILEGTFGALEGMPTKYVNTFFQPSGGLVEDYDLTDKAWSIFGTVDFEITDRVTLTGGFNYTDDKKRYAANVISSDVYSAVDFDAAAYAPFRYQLLLGGALAQGLPLASAQAFAAANQNNPAANPLNAIKPFQFFPQYLSLPNSVEDGRLHDTNFSYTGRLAWKMTDSINAYASYSTGFKASSVNLSRDSRPLISDRTSLMAAGLTRVNQSYGSRFAGPEKAKVMELGIKGKWDQVAFNLTAFKQSINGFQSNVFTGTGFRLANAGKQSTFGIEFDGTVKPVDALTFSVAMVYLDPKYDSFTNSAYGDISGQTPSGIPALSTTLGAAFEQPFGDDNKFILSGSYHYESSVKQADGGILAAYSREVNSIDASAAVELGNGLRFSIWGRNLGDSRYLTTIFPSVGQNGSISGYPSLPRTYGAAIKYKF